MQKKQVVDNELSAEQVLRTFNHNAVAPPQQHLIHELFERQVKLTPDALALVYQGQSLTFAELNRRANQLARRLRSQGVGPDRLVGICLERSVEMLVAVLGVFKAGGAYVPLDPSYPADRIAYILTDAAPQIVLTRRRFENALPLKTATCIPLDGQWDEIFKEEGTNLDSSAVGLTARHLAYVIYTSGSTGKPNGVMVEHHNVVNYWPVIERIYRHPVECRRIAVNAPFAFDVSVQQFVLLLSGCSMFLIPEDVRRDAQLLVRFLEENKIEGVDCTPSQLNTWIAAGLLEKSGYGLRTLVVGGEALDEALWNRLARHPGVISYNVYGPTETTVFCTATRITDASAVSHIGRPTENAFVYILDSEHRPVPIGVAGEIFIGGAGVARGYLNRPELTANRFTTDPFRQDSQARIYKTGDLARWRADGNIEFLGRNDHQIKIRGFRIELGEIETQLLRHAQVSEAVVIAREDTPGEKRLVAYVTLRDPPGSKTAPSIENLRAHLAALLPEHMIPSAYVILQSLPLTPNGKLDRQALPAPQLRAGSNQQYEAPRGEIEEGVAEIWQQVLRVDKIGRQDKFLELGGHSVQGMRLIVRIAERFEVQMAFPDVFQYPTVLQMAEIVQSRKLQKLVADSQQPSASNQMESEGGVI